ncbi:MAG TPA: hypothetical protein VM695_16445, partial [Phycisphaerae bacterium]|nr:hypothetical protein [Phycisphaerae bacterium]
PAPTASIAIEAVQGTEGGPKVAGDEVTVELFHHGRAIKTIETQLDEHGVVTVEDLPLMPPFQPRVTIRHAGASYPAVGRPMTVQQPSQKITVKVHEVGQVTPDWDVAMRHVIVRAVPEGLHVTEMLAVRNPTDRAWLSAPDADGKRSSVALPLPAGAQNVEPGGAFDSCCTRVADGKLVSSAPLTPGLSQYQVSYLVPAPGGEAEIAVVAPAAVRNLMVFVPEDGSTQAQAEGLSEAGVFDVHKVPMRCYKAADLAAGQRTALRLSNLPRMQQPEDAPGAASQTPQLLAAIGGGAMLVICLFVLLSRSNRKPHAAKPESA